MARRNHRTAIPGQVYATEWPQWHVDCAAADCDSYALVAPIGEAFTIAEAEKQAKDEPELAGWKRIKGFWYCPKHIEES